MKKNLLFPILVSLALALSNYDGSAQTNWVKLPANPILSAGTTWTDHGFPFVFLTKIDDTLRMWFTASDGNTIANDKIGYATSVNGLGFTINQNPVLEPNTGGTTFDSQGVFGASVLFDGNTYRMWYNGYNSQPYYTGELRAGLATSPDGITWTKYDSEPVLKLGLPGSWDDFWAYVNTVLFEGGIYKMWYTGSNGSSYHIGYATSPDGVIWTKSASNPIIEATGAASGGFDAVQNPRVIHSGSGYEMWFNAKINTQEFDVYYATSSDGISWNYTSVPVLTTGTPGQFDALWAWHPCVIKDNGVYRMWYSGYDGNEYAVGYAVDSTTIGIGEATEAKGSGFQCVYPNPFVDRVTIVVSGDLGNSNYEICGIAGNVVRRGRLEARKTEIMLVDLNKGSYFLRLADSNNSSAKLFKK